MTDPVATFALVLGVLLCGLLTVLVLHYSSHWLRVPNSGARLPKGSFGWPILGETLALIRDPLGFALSHKKRYGSIFKSSILMKKSIVGTTPEFAKFVLSNLALFPVEYPKFISAGAGSLDPRTRHVVFKKSFIKLSLQESLQIMVGTLERIILENLALSEEKGTVLATGMTEKLVQETSSYIALGIEDVRSTSDGRKVLQDVLTAHDAIFALPINLPGTAHYKGRKAMEVLRVYLQSVLDRRRSQDDTKNDINDMVRVLIDGSREGVIDLDDKSLIDQMLSIWFGSFKTTETTLTWLLKYLVDHPHIYRRIQAEQQGILRGKDLSVAGPRLTFEDTKTMVYTNKFFQEVQRYLSITNYLPRTAAQDIVYDGILIPKGWTVLTMVNYVHFDPANYRDPANFNPDRFDAPAKAYMYLPFGSGAHRCPGEEIAKLVTLIFIHHVTTTYTYEREGPDRGVKHNGLPVIVGGYPIKVRSSN